MGSSAGCFRGRGLSPRGAAWCRVRSRPGCRVLELRDESEELTLLVRGEGGGDHVAFARVERWEQLVDDRLGGGGDVDEQLATVSGMGEASDQASLLEVVEQRRHRARGDEEPLGDHGRLERFAGALDDREDLTSAWRELVLVECLAVVQRHEQVGRAVDIGEALGGEGARARILVLEVVAYPNQGFGDARRLRRGQCAPSSPEALTTISMRGGALTVARAIASFSSGSPTNACA